MRSGRICEFCGADFTEKQGLCKCLSCNKGYCVKCMIFIDGCGGCPRCFSGIKKDED